jgi:hypothetical protein
MTAHDGSAPDADGVPDDDWMSHIPQPQVVAQYLGFESSALDEFKRDFEALHARFRALFVPKPAAPEPAEALGEDRPICDMPPGVGPCDTPAGSRVGCKQLREQNAALRRLIAAAHDAASRLDWGKADAKGCDLRDALLNYERAARPTQEAKPADAASDARVEAAFEDLECAAAAYDRGKNGSGCDTLLANVNKAREALRALLRPAPAVSDAEHAAAAESFREAVVRRVLAHGEEHQARMDAEDGEKDAYLRLMRSRPAASVNAERMEAIALRCDGCGIRVADNSLSVERPGFALLCPTCMGSPRVTAAESATPPRPAASDEGLRELRDDVQREHDREATMAKAGGSIAGAVVGVCERLLKKIDRLLAAKPGGAP